jgi:uncharacterized heparinase superfamily protein
LIRIGRRSSGLSAGRTHAERFQRLTWRTPIHGMRLKGRHPLKLIAVPDDPFVGDSRPRQWLLDGVINFRGEDAADRRARISPSPIGRRPSANICTASPGCAICRASRPARRRRRSPRRSDARWLEAHAETVSDPAWRADLWGRRILFWTAHAPLILSSSDLVYRRSVLNMRWRGAPGISIAGRSLPAGRSARRGAGAACWRPAC